MTTKTITIAGKEVTLAYCYATEIAFRKYTDVSIDNFDPTNPEHVLYLILASILSWYQSQGDKAPVTDDDLLYKSQPAELVNALTEIFKLRNEWYHVPSGEPEDKEKDTDKKPADAKNG